MNSFEKIIEEESKKEYFIKLMEYIDLEYSNKEIYPMKEDIFNSFKLTPFEKVKVVILGQDPYHGEGEAHGLSFSVKPGVKVPPSLKNIYKELNTDIGLDIPNNGYLIKWANEGVLLLNSVLTVEKDNPGSHRKKGWETFTDYVITKLNEKETPTVFVLWGNYAKEKEVLITNKKHLVITSPHPSPFSARTGFFGSKPFSKINDFLKSNNIEEIDFKIEDLEENNIKLKSKKENNKENKLQQTFFS